MISPIPSRYDCRVANPELWSYFANEFQKVNKMRPCASWTEEEVQQWLDFNVEGTYEKEASAEIEAGFYLISA